MKDGQGEWKVSNSTPLHVKIPKAASHTSSDLYATIEWFYCQGTDKDEHGMKPFKSYASSSDSQSIYY